MHILYPVEDSLKRSTELRFGDINDSCIDFEPTAFTINVPASLDNTVSLIIADEEIASSLPPLLIRATQIESMLFTNDENPEPWRITIAKRSASLVRWALTDNNSYVYQNVSHITHSELPDTYQNAINRLSNDALLTAGLAKFRKL